jgi:hypothetical protein
MKIKLHHSLSHLFFIFLFLLPLSTEAHSPDQSYLYMRIYGDAIGGRVEATAKDLNRSLNLNLPDAMTMEALQPHIQTIQNYLLSKVAFSSTLGKHNIRFTDAEILMLDEMESFAKFNFELEGIKEVPDALDISYAAFFDSDPIHRGLCIVEYNWKAGVVNNESMMSLIFGPDEIQQQLDLKDASVWKGFWALIKLGVWHIWIGLDHILFILALILPAVVRRREGLTDMHSVVEVGPEYSKSWMPVAKFKPAFIYIIKIITFFTIAHSITLALAALGYINLSSRIVESIIAISIALAAIHNIVPVFKSKEWMIAFGFGLFHGFGFASVLGEKGLSGDYMVLSLLGFNVGVELGQVLIICMIFPFLFLLRRLNVYPKLINYGSVVLILISIYWFIERMFEVDLPAGRIFRSIYQGIFGG